MLDEQAELEAFVKQQIGLVGQAMDVMLNDGLDQKIAKFARRVFDALIKQGFSEEQALALTTSSMANTGLKK